MLGKKRLIKFMNFSFALLLYGTVSTSAFSQTSGLDTEGLDSVVQSSTVFIVGEDHEELEAKSHLPEIVKKVIDADSSYNCLALEFPTVLQNLFNSSNRSGNFDVFLETYIRNYDPERASSAIRLKNSVTKLNIYFKAWRMAASAMKDHGGNVVLIDDLSRGTSDLDFRNQAMASEISRVIKNGNCIKLVSINGSAHMEGKASAIGKYLSVKYSYGSLRMGRHNETWLGIEP